MTNTLLTELNAFRKADGKAELASWKKARNQPELDAYRKAAEKAAKAAAKADTAKAPKGETKKARTISLLQRKGGATLTDIATALSIGDTAARSLIGDVKQAGITVRTERKDGKLFYMI